MRLLPREEQFYEYFAKQTAMIQEAAAILVNIVDNGHAAELAEKLEKLEHEGDLLMREVSKRLQSAFITPLDAEDIHRLASGFDSIIDYIENTAYQLALYKIEHKPAEMAETVRLIAKAAESLDGARAQLEKNEPTDAFFSQIAMLEDQVDQLTGKMITDLFEHENDWKRLIKAKEIIQMLEATTDRFLIVADIIENIYIKNS